MKKIFLLCLTLLATVSAVAEITVCDVAPDENGHFDSPFIKSGSITWNAASHTLTLDNAVVEHSSETPYDYVYPIRLTEDATIIIKGECKLTTTGFVAIGFEGTNSKNVTIQGNGKLYLSSIMRGIYLRLTRLTIKDITLETTKGIMNNGDGLLCALTFDNVKADINGVVERIGESITFQNCAITYPQDAYIEHNENGYYIASGNGSLATHIVILRNGSGILGDVNGDDEVNIADVNAIISVILGNGNNARADVNKDGEVNIADVNAVIDIILHPGVAEEHEYVDLGLPSGTLWATCNVGANAPEEYGDYFAWGETAPKQVYNWSTYKWCNGESNSITKYCTFSNSGYNGFTDGKTELEPEDDAATVNWGSSAQMPSLTQIKELVNLCSWEWTMRNQVYGQLVTGPNGNSIFFPATGYSMDSSVNLRGSCGFSWTRTLGDGISGSACNLNYESGSVIWRNKYSRNYGFTVRAVHVAQN